MNKLIIQNGIKVYKNHFCNCPCHKRIPFKKSNLSNGIPKYINGHNMNTKLGLKKRNKILSEQTIIENNIKVYKNYYCQCRDKYGTNCGMKIPYPTTESGLKNHIYGGIPKCISHHQIYSPEFGEKMSKITRNENNPHWIDGYAQERGNNKIRNKGFIPLNHKTIISNTQHHLDNEIVIFEPKELHELCYHSGYYSKGEHKLIANLIAIAWKTVQDKLEHNFNYIKFYNSLNLRK